MSWITQHVTSVLQIVGGVVSVATVVVKLTPTPADDCLLAKLITVLSALSLCNPDGTFIGGKDK